MAVKEKPDIILQLPDDAYPLSHLTVDVTESQQFWRQHPHMFSGY